MAPLVKTLQAQPAFEVKVCVTAQHRQMLDQVLSLSDIRPDYDLNLMKPGQDLYDITSGVLTGIKPVLRRENGVQTPCNVYLIEPLDYLPFVYLMDRSPLILTDSGGIKEEAPSLGKPVLVMRDTTERPEAIEAGTVRPGGPAAQQHQG